MLVCLGAHRLHQWIPGCGQSLSARRDERESDCRCHDRRTCSHGLGEAFNLDQAFTPRHSRVKNVVGDIDELLPTRVAGGRGRSVLRGLSLLPWVLPGIVTAFLWAWMFNAQYGVVNAFLLKIGIIHAPVAWLATTSGAMGGIVVARAWMSLPWYMVMFLAGLQSVPSDVVEAARVDGGGNFTVLRHVVLPHINYTMLVALMLGAIGNLQLFDLIYAMTGGGPVNGTAVLSLQVYQQAFQNFDFGMASTIGVVWLIAMIVPMVIALRVLMPARQRPHV
jgi:ABC-type sugar transport system permease subunit